MAEIISQGAEAKIFLEEGVVLKDRVKKSYRLDFLDEKIRKSRTKREAKLLERAGELINVPKVLRAEKFQIKIEYIDGERLSETLNLKSEEEQFEIMEKIGEQIAKIHEKNIIHGDLTTSNTLLKDGEVFIIDFGLGFISSRIEDKAVDLHLIKQALEAKHFQNHEKLFNEFLKKYKYAESKDVLERLKKVESRGRYKH